MEKSIRFGLILTIEEKTAVENLAEFEGGLSKAALLRRLIREAAKKQGIWPNHAKEINHTHPQR